MEELNKRLEFIEKDYLTFQNQQKQQEKNQKFDYKKMINQNIIETEQKYNRLNSFLTDNEIYKQSNEFYDFNKKEDILTKKKDVFTVDNEIKVKPIMYLALSYDHRIIDGKESVSFLKKSK